MTKNLDRFRAYFGADVPDADEAHILCPWHDDSNPSLHLQIAAGNYRCYGCGKSGSIDQLIADNTFIEESVVEAMHAALISEGGVLGFLLQSRRITGDTIRKYRLGYNGGRISIPVRDSEGRCVNLRLYKPGDKSGSKVISYGAGFGGVRWFPYPPEAEDVVVICEGEMDCLLARQMGLPAFTTTGGALSWFDNLNPALYGKDVVLCYDMDRSGRTGAAKAIAALKKCTRRIRDIHLPLTGNGKDFTDWVIGGGTVSDWHKMTEMTPAYVRSAFEMDLGESIAVPLWEATNAKNSFKPLAIDVIVAGKESSPYLIPLEVEIECNRSNKPATCSACNVSNSNRVRIGWCDGQVLGLIGITDDYRNAKIRQIAGVPQQCKMNSVVVRSYQNVENVALLPAFDPGMDENTENKYTYRQGFFLGTGVTSNSRYTMRGICVPNQKDQTAAIVIVEAEPSEKDLLVLIDRAEIEAMRYEVFDSAHLETGRGIEPDEIPTTGARTSGDSDDPAILLGGAIQVAGGNTSEGMA